MVDNDDAGLLRDQQGRRAKLARERILYTQSRKPAPNALHIVTASPIIRSVKSCHTIASAFIRG
jgi:hypothetical protein